MHHRVGSWRFRHTGYRFHQSYFVYFWCWAWKQQQEMITSQQLAKVHSCHWKGKSILTYLDLCVLFYLWIVVCLLLTVQWLWDCWLSFIVSFCCIDAGMTMHTVTISQWDRDMKRLWLWSIEMWSEGFHEVKSVRAEKCDFCKLSYEKSVQVKKGNTWQSPTSPACPTTARYNNFLGYGSKNVFSTRFSPVAGKWSKHTIPYLHNDFLFEPFLYLLCEVHLVPC